MVAIPQLSIEPSDSTDGPVPTAMLTEVQSHPTSADDGVQEGQIQFQGITSAAEKQFGTSVSGQTGDQERGLVERDRQTSGQLPENAQESVVSEEGVSSENVTPDRISTASSRIVRIVFGVSIVFFLLLGVWFWRTSGKDAQVMGPVTADKPSMDSSTDLDPGTNLDVQKERDDLWVPSDAGFFIYADLSAELSQGYSQIFGDFFTVRAASEWANEMIKALGIRHEVIARMMLSGDQRLVPSTMVLELKEHQRADQLNALGQFLETIGPWTLRQLNSGSTRLVFVVVTANRVVIGREDVVRRICAGERFTDVERILMERLKSKPACLAMIRPATLHNQPPLWWFDPWPELDQVWRALWSQTDVFVTSLRSQNQQTLFSCEWFTKDPKAKESLEKNIRGLMEWLIQYSETVASGEDASETTPGNMSNGKEHDGNLLAVWLSAMKGAKVDVADTSVVVTFAFGANDAPDQFLRDSVATVLNLWQKSAQTALGGRQSRLGTALSQYEGVGQLFPAAAGGGVLLPPETRLSWIADLLPYLNRQDWAKSLQMGYSWNSVQNRQITQRYLSDVVNPLLGPTQTLGGYFDSHFVGVTGVGKDSGELPPTHPRAGIFNFRYPVRRSDVKDGLSNTIAILGAEKQLGPWAAGGRATARALTTPPYVGGPDGFGSARPEGMLVTMADGSVRFLRKDIDPRVVEQLATIAGSEPVTVDILEPTRNTSKGAVVQTGDKNGAGIKSVQIDIPVMQSWRDPCGPSAETTESEKSIEESLKQRLSHVGFRTSFALAVGLWTQWSGVPLSVDPESVEWAHVTGQEVIKIDMQDVSFEDLAKKVAEQVGLSFLKCHRSAVFVVSDRLSDHVRCEFTRGEGETTDYPSIETLSLICDWLNRSVGESPERITQVFKDGDRLAIEGPFCVVFEIKRMLEITRDRDNSNDALDESDEPTINLNFFEPTRLIDVGLAINRLAGDKVFFDWTSLATTGVTPDTEVSISASDEPLPGVLKRLAGSIGADVQQFASGAFLICAVNRFSPGVLRLYEVEDVLDRGITPGSLRERIVKECVPESWVDGGGKGTLVYDVSTKAFVVLNSVAVHRELTLWFQKIRGDFRGR